jgi:crotonobetaine/carnitine-CoA ligase
MYTDDEVMEVILHEDPIGVATSGDLVFPALVRAQADRIGDRPFLVDVKGPQESYRETYESSLRWASVLESYGVGRDDNVGVILHPCFEAHHIWLACGWLGARDAPLNPDYRGRMLSFSLNNARPRVLVTTSQFLKIIEEVEHELTALERVIVIDDAPRKSQPTKLSIERWSSLRPAKVPLDRYQAPCPGDVASLIYTSGTTGRSKGVLVRWSQFALASDTIPLGLVGEEAADYSFYPIYHVSGKAKPVAMARIGGRVVIAERFSTSRFWEHIRTYRCTSVGLAGALAQFVTSAEHTPDDVSSLKYISMSPCPQDVDEIARRLDVVVSTKYASTEVGIPIANRMVTGANYASCGHLRDGYEARIIDVEGNDVADGEVGELLVKAKIPELMSAGYFALEDQSADAWRDGWFHSGDGMRRDSEGRYYFIDRIKDAIRRRGENISSFEVETYVEDHPDVECCAAIAVPSEYAEDEVKVCVIIRAGASLSPAELYRWLLDRMPRFMQPRFIEVLEHLPLTETGKVKKAELRTSGVTPATWDASHPM